MKRFKKILFVPSAKLTEPDASFRKAVQLAGDNSASLTVFGVIHQNDLSDKTIEELVYSERLPELSALASYASQKGVPTQFKLSAGIPFLRIIQEILKHGHDLVITHLIKARGLKEWIFGGTNLHLLRKCPCPVWVMKPQVSESYRQILAAVDPCSTEPGEAELNIRIVEIAASMAAREQGQLHLLHAWSHEMEDLLRARGRVSDQRMNSRLEAVRGHHRAKFDELVKVAQGLGVTAETHFLEGSPAQLVPEWVAKLDINLLVMGTVCRTGIAGFLIGNTAEQVLEQVQCPLLAIKPDGFRTPVPLENPKVESRTNR